LADRTNLLEAGEDATNRIFSPHWPCAVFASTPPSLSPPLLLLGSLHLLFLKKKGFPWKLLQWFPPALK
jgi:hypothetical protein